jgi:hypothetical protein
MTAVKTLTGEKLLIQIGDGGSPSETFAHPCLINAERGMQFSSETTEIITPDCDDPTLPAFKQIFKDGLSIQVTGGGVLHTSDLEAYFEWMKLDTAKNVRIKFDVSGALGGGYVSLAMKLTAFNVTGTRKNNATVEITLMSHGEATWTDAA